MTGEMAKHENLGGLYSCGNVHPALCSNPKSAVTVERKRQFNLDRFLSFILCVKNETLPRPASKGTTKPGDLILIPWDPLR